MRSTEEESIAGIVSSRYAGIGSVQSIEKRDFGSACNSHYLIATNREKFVLKEMPDPREIFDDPDDTRLETLGKTVALLANSGAALLVEQIVPADSGAYTVGWRASRLRLFKWVEAAPFVADDASVKRALSLLRAFHGVDLLRLDARLLRELSGLATPYALDKVAHELPRLGHFVQTADIDDEIAEAFPELVSASERLLRQAVPSPMDKALCHLDFHADNLLVVSDGRIVVVDFDNVLIQSPLKCLAFALSRFARTICHRSGQTLSPSTLSAFIDRVAPSYFDAKPSSEIVDAILYWMEFLEVEKTLRILYRVMKTARHRNYLKNIARVHLPQYRIVSALRAGR